MLNIFFRDCQIRAIKLFDTDDARIGFVEFENREIANFIFKKLNSGILYKNAEGHDIKVLSYLHKTVIGMLGN
jgi:hypothetical protein